MPNETVAIVPRNLDEKHVLKIFLSALVESVDKLLGLKQGGISVLDLQSSIDEINLKSSAAEAEAEEVTVFPLEASSLKLVFDCRNDNAAVVIQKSSAVNSGARTGVGIYLFSIEEQDYIDVTYFTSNVETSVIINSSTEIEIRVYSGGVLADLTIPVTVSGTYVSTD